MSEVAIFKCDWNNCTESIEVIPGAPFSDTWLTVIITNHVTGQATTYHLDPLHARMLRDDSMNILADLVPRAV